ncbi:DNA uptake protein ComE [Hyunsoonleella jejuensis]|uniref:DNA uptake protein ComE n=1 Tax=Hyunsoonleella jejuensis TaxID=419940 RepID=A0A1H9DHF3_9FLAO|nr:helix-hairpin-helix domain-containing protein [Hyunsoonleella jejuensis]SEQ12910.1 DNA uptake protein ComE [Hyunsoonleella jejuensis]
MNNFKSHFVFTKEQRNGIFLLLLIIVVLQCIYFFVDFSSGDVVADETELKIYKAEIDSLRRAKIEDNKPKIYPFNPNYITDYKGSALGMSNEEIDRLLAFRKQNKWINSIKQFQEVTKVSDSLLAEISPYFKFPEWVSNPEQQKVNTDSYNNRAKTFAQKKDLNKATAIELQRVNGVGKTLSERITIYRDKFNGGFIADVQLEEVYGLSPEVISKITEQFTVKTPRKISKINLNTASADDLVSIQHIDYEIAYNIIEYRNLNERFKALDELSKVKDFPTNKLEIIKLSLQIQ